METVRDILSGLAIGGSHIVMFMRQEIVVKPLRALGFYKIPSDLTGDIGELKVVGVGYGRTGTVSCSYLFCFCFI